jgi:N-acetyl sugar amidotransferase
MIKKIIFCKKCLYSNLHPFGLTFDENGICSGCTIHDEKNQLNWKERYNKLLKLIYPYKSRSNKNYDCIIPVTGGQDSYFIVFIAKFKLGLNPLVVNYNKYFNTPLGIRNLANLRNKFDVDIILQNVNPISVKKITKHTLMEYGNFYWPILAGHTVFPVQVAVKYKIPLIIWGAHQGLEQTGMFSHTHEVEMTRRYRSDHDLFGTDSNKLKTLDSDLKEEDIIQYKYPDHKELDQVGVRGIYLGNYIRWDPAIQHKKMVKDFNYKSSSFGRTFDCYDYVDCFNYMNLHDVLKLYKLGYSKVTDHACREIRFNRISRNQGINLVRKYELNPPKYINLFSRWLGANEKALEFIFNKQRNSQFWKAKENNKWKFKGLSTLLKKNKDKKKKYKLIKIFKANSKLEYNKNSEYITFGKGI